MKKMILGIILVLLSILACGCIKNFSNIADANEEQNKVIGDVLPLEQDKSVSESLLLDSHYFFLNFLGKGQTRVFIKQQMIDTSSRINPTHVVSDRFITTLDTSKTESLFFLALPGEFEINYVNDSEKLNTIKIRLDRWHRGAKIDTATGNYKYISSDSSEFQKYISSEKSTIDASMRAGFLISATGEEFAEKNAQTIESPFMHMDYEKKHAASDEEIYKEGGIEWALIMKENQPNQKIILRYIATMTGKIPVSFEKYLEDELKTLERYLSIAKDKGVFFDLIEFGDEFNGSARFRLKFSEAQVYTYYEESIKLIHKIMPDTKICMDIIPIYAFSEEVFSPGDGYNNLKSNQVVDDVTFVKELLRRGTPFQVVGIEVQPGAHTYHDMSYTKRHIDSLIALGVEVYIWEFWIPGEPIENMNDIYLHNQPAKGYSEEWQYSVMKEMLTYFSQRPSIIGFNYMGVSGESFVEKEAVLTKEDGTYTRSYILLKDWVKFTF